MAAISIAEFSGTATIRTSSAGVGGFGSPSFAGLAPVPQTPALAYQAVTLSGSSTPSAAFNAGTFLVRIVSDATCCLDFGATPVAVPRETPGTTIVMFANVPEYFGVLPGQKVAAIASS